jgi:hypothetical protein
VDETTGVVSPALKVIRIRRPDKPSWRFGFKPRIPLMTRIENQPLRGLTPHP